MLKPALRKSSPVASCRLPAGTPSLSVEFAMSPENRKRRGRKGEPSTAGTRLARRVAGDVCGPQLLQEVEGEKFEAQSTKSETNSKERISKQHNVREFQAFGF